MGEWLIKALVIAIAAWVVWSILQSRYVFEIRIKGGQPRVRRGKVTPAFLVLVAEACQTDGVARGWIGGVQRGRRTALRFSCEFPPGLQQRLRNAWQAAG
jgi:hypothetical protein